MHEQDLNETQSKLLSAGKNVKLKVYHSLVSKAANGKILTPDEIKTYDLLNEDLQGEVNQESPGNKNGHAENTLPNLRAVFKFLKEQNWRISQSGIYKHRDEGKIRSRGDGMFHLRDVLKYASDNLERIGGLSQTAPNDKVQQDKASADTRKALAQAELSELKAKILSNSYVPREQFESELAARAAIFRSDAESFFRGAAAAMVNITTGDPAKTPDLIAYCLDALEQWLARYLQKEEFTVDTAAYERIFEKADSDDEEEKEDVVNE